MPIAEDAIFAALKRVDDPELMLNVVDLGLVYEVLTEEVDGKTNIHVKMTLTSPACPVGPQIVQEARDVLLDLEGVGEAEVEVVFTPLWTPDRMTEEARDELGMF